MRASSLALIVAFALAVPAAHANAQQPSPPIVVVGSADALAPPAQAPVVPPGYEIEGDLGGMHFRGRLYAPSAPSSAVPAPVAPVAPVAPTPPPQLMTQQQPQVLYAPPQAYTPLQQVAAPHAYREDDAAPRLDDGMDFGGRVAMDILGAGVGVGLAIGLGFAVNDGSRVDGGQMAMTLGASAGLVPAGISILGGAVAGGRGRYGGAMLGEMVGGGLGSLALALGDLGSNDPWMQMGVVLGPAVLGAIVGFEAQHAIRTARVERTRAQEDLRVTGGSISPLASSAGGGALLSLSGEF